jgi:hypothetical protein
MAQWLNRLALGLLALLGVVSLMVGLFVRYGTLAAVGRSASRPSGGADLTYEALRLHQAELDRLVADVRARFAAKQDAVRSLLEGKSRLTETLAHFRRLSTSRLVDGNALTEEAVCRDVVIHAEYLHRDRPQEEAAAAVASLETQVREHLAGRARPGK